jgi:hypothetical protein
MDNIREIRRLDFLKNRKPIKLKLGEHYSVRFSWNRPRICKFIKVTDKGYNFLNLKTNKCILYARLYRSSCEWHKSDDWFWIDKRFIVCEFK